MVDRRDIFRAATAALGKPLMRETFPQQTRAVYDEIEERANDLITHVREEVPTLPEIYFDFILNGQVNAWAFRLDDGYYIGLTSGMIYMLRLVIGRMLSDPAIFPDIGDPTEEHSDLKPLADYMPDAEALYKSHALLTPQNAMRRAYASYLNDQAIMFYLGHEIAHITRGHVDFLRVERNEAHAAELSYVEDLAERFERQCIEHDADRRSVCSRISSIHTTQSNPDYPGLPWYENDKSPIPLLRGQLRALEIVFRLFGDRRFSRSELSEASYPPHAIRRRSNMMIAGGEFERYWGPQHRSAVFAEINRTMPEVEIAFATIVGEEVRYEGLREAFGEAGTNHIRRLHDYWNEQMVERLRPYAFEF